MLVTSLEDMERIVASRNDLSWDGWDVVKYTNANNAIYSPDGAFRNGKWAKKKVFPVTRDGWYLPNSIGRNHDQVDR